MLFEVFARAMLTKLERAGSAFVDLAEETMVAFVWIGAGVEIVGCLVVVEGVDCAGHCFDLEELVETS